MILIVTQPYPPTIGGIEVVVSELALQLHAANYPIAVLANNRGAAKAITEYDALSPLTIHRFGPLGRSMRKRNCIKQYAKQQLQAIIFDTWKSVESIGSTTLTPLKLRGIKLLCMGHGNEFCSTTPRHKRRREAALALADTIVCNSQNTAQLLQDSVCELPAVRQLGPSSEAATSRQLAVRQELAAKTVVIPPGLATCESADEEYRGQLLAMAAPQSAGQGSGQGSGQGPILVSCGRLEPRKGFDKIIELMPKLKQHYPHLHYFIAGDGADRQRLEKLTEQWAKGSVDFLGFISNARKTALLEIANLHVMPVRRQGQSIEGFGIIYAEAASCGTLSIGGHNSGATDAIVDGQTGWLCDGNDSDSIANAILQGLSSSQAALLAPQAAQIAVAKFGWQQVIEQWQNILRNT